VAFEADLHSGQLPDIDASLMQAAVAVAGDDALANWHWPPVPTEQQLNDLSGWLEWLRSERDAGRRRKRWMRELRGTAPTRQGAGTPIGAARLQNASHPPDELLRRLKFVIEKHERDHGRFRREYLDHRSEHYIRDADGGLSNKQVTFLANHIAGNSDARSFDETWTIITKHLAECAAAPSELHSTVTVKQKVKPPRGRR
jgi:hypothetical protein